MQIKNRFTGAVILERETLAGANLSGADLSGANLSGADLSGADLSGASLHSADLSGASLHSANLRGANLRDADLRDADLRGAIMPDGRTYEEYRADHLAGLCKTPEIKARAIAAWGKHRWTNCPMHCALGIDSSDDASEVGADPKLVAAWVALYDGEHLVCPGCEPAAEPSPDPSAEVAP